MSAPLCPYCGGRSELVTGDVIYPRRRDLRSKSFYRCKPCGAWVGCHPGTVTPLGRLANDALRRAKSAAHAAFDSHWQSRRMSRGDAYSRLAAELGIDRSDCHIGMFDEELCARTVELCRGWNVDA